MSKFSSGDGGEGEAHDAAPGHVPRHGVIVRRPSLASQRRPRGVGQKLTVSPAATVTSFRVFASSSPPTRGSKRET